MSAYASLPHDGSSIRLVELAPGKPGDELKGKFVVHDLNDKRLKYTATSYVCGNDDRSRYYILMSDTKLGIYKNADEVLRRFRSEKDINYLWIDVVCINQDDPAEKAREVAFMYKVYQNAIRTVIWLGQLDPDTRAAIEYVRTLDVAKYLKQYKPTVLYAGYETEYIRGKSHILDALEGHPQMKSLINSCAEFLLRPYFTRVWTQQEGSLSADPIIYCGAEGVTWNHVFALAWLFQPRYTMTWPDWFLSNYPNKRYAQLEPNLFFINSVQEYRLRQSMLHDDSETQTREISLLRAMHEASRFKCYDPRDKIFAVRNVATDLATIGDWAPQPDYVTPWEDVYTDFAARVAARDESVLLEWSGLTQQGDNSGLPSWVIDWRSRPWLQYIKHEGWSAGGKKFRAKAEVLPKKRRNQIIHLLQSMNQPRKSLRYSLHVTCMMQDTIAYLSGVLKNWTVFADIVALNQEVLALDAACVAYVTALPQSTYITPETVVEAYEATLIAKTTDQDAVATKEYVTQGAKQWRIWLAAGANTKDGSMPKYHDAIDSMDVFQYKQFCVSNSGYFCLVPDISESTDIVAIVKGLDVPVVLRPVGEHYVYLGQCYIHGMMEPHAGELIEEFRVKCDSKAGQSVVGRPGGDVRKNGWTMNAGEYIRILETLGERKVELV